METCPNCGADLPKNAKACPECGSDEKTGWAEEAYVGALDLPDEEFDYEKFAKKEFGTKTEIVPQGLHWFWWAVAIFITAALFLTWFGLQG